MATPATPRVVNGYTIAPGANLREANLAGAVLMAADLFWADLRQADLREANLREANLRRADLREANLSGAKGLLDPADYLSAHFEHDPTRGGYIAYKTFGASYPPPSTWRIEPGAVISEVVNPCPTTDCASGINVAPLDWVQQHAPGGPIWQVLIRYEWLASVVVPYGSEGKIRCSRVEVLGIVEREGANG